MTNMTDNCADLICLCGMKLRPKINEDKVICPNCHLVISPLALELRYHTKYGVKLIPYINTGHHDNDLFGKVRQADNPKEIPVYKRNGKYYIYETQYGEGRMDDCISWIEGINIADKDDRYIIKNHLLRTTDKGTYETYYDLDL